MAKSYQLDSPVSAPTAHRLLPKPRLLIARGNASIVWIDTDLDFTLFVRRELRRRGIANPLICLNNEHLAYSYLSRFAHQGLDGFPRLIVIEVRSAMIEGFALLKWIRAQRVVADVPVLLIGTDFRWTTNQAKALGAVDFWPKSRNQDGAAALVERILREWLF